MALFVVQNIKPLKFHLLGLKQSEYDKYKKLITDNGGEVSPTGGYPVINFSMPGCFQNNKLVFHVCYIEECIRKNRILNLVDFNISEKNGYEGCPLSSLIFGSSRCKLALVSVPSALSEKNGDLQYNQRKDIKSQECIAKNSVDKPLEKNISLVEYTDDDDEDENGNDDDKSNERENSLHKVETIEKSLLNEQISLYQSTNSSTDIHNSGVITTKHMNTPNSAKRNKCEIKEIIHETKDQNTLQSNKKLNSLCSYTSTQTPQSKLIDHVNLISDGEEEIVPENSIPQALNSTMMDFITDDKDEIELFIEGNETFVSSSYKKISRKEIDSNIVNKLNADCSTSNDSIISNTTDDLSDSPENMKTRSSYKKFSNLRLKKN